MTAHCCAAKTLGGLPCLLSLIRPSQVRGIYYGSDSSTLLTEPSSLAPSISSRSKVGEALDSDTTLSTEELVAKFALSVEKRGAQYWKKGVASTERIIAQIAGSRTRCFQIRYYSIGIEAKRLASAFILDADGRRPELPGFFDWEAPQPVRNMEEFFDLSHRSTHWRRWRNSSVSFKTTHRLSVVLRLHEVDGTEFIGLDVRSDLEEYPLGRLIGGLPFGTEDTFLAICKIDKNDQGTWSAVLESHEKLFRAWNVICRKGSRLKRILVEGEPGAGKELWFGAIRSGSRPHRVGEWRTLSATLPIQELKSLLYGQRDGVLEQLGFLALCAEGGIFIDEIGKSSKEFRRDLLRVLEAGEFVPLGGSPTPIRNVLFVFASTPADRQAESDPPDFWTRMDVELTLLPPIKLMPPNGCARAASPFDKKDSARFHALFGTFWLEALEGQLKERFTRADPSALLRDMSEQVVAPIVALLAAKLADAGSQDFADGLPVSPRRIRTLAATIASEYQWLGNQTQARGKHEVESGGEAFHRYREQFVDDFLSHLVQDKTNNDALRLEGDG